MLMLYNNRNYFRFRRFIHSKSQSSTAQSSSKSVILSIPVPISVLIFSQNTKSAAHSQTKSNLNQANPRILKVVGPLGSIVLAIPSSMRASKVEKNGNTHLELKLNSATNPALVRSASQELLTIKAHLLNIFKGVTEGFMIKLNLVGLFYSVRIYNKAEDFKKQLAPVLRLNIGKSHPVSIEIPKDILISYKQVNFIKTILIYGISLERVTKIASEIRAYSPVERYKGKGFRFSDSFVVIKAKK